jgi:hypothetical protein
MKKTIITIFAFVVLFGFAASGVMAQTWTWNGPYSITAPSAPATKYIEIAADPKGDALLGIDDKNGISPIDFATHPSKSKLATDLTLGSAVDLVVGPDHVTYVIDNDTVGTWDGTAFQPLPSDQQPNVPDDAEAGDVYRSIAAGMNGKLYVLFEKSSVGSPQYLLVGSSPAIPVGVRFTPRKLNLGSNGRWVSCSISNLPAGYTVDPNSVCITAIDGTEIEPICRVDGPVNAGETLKVKFPRSALAAAITTGGSSVELTVKGYVTVGAEGFEFSGTDTINTKAKKVK